MLNAHIDDQYLAGEYLHLPPDAEHLITADNTRHKIQVTEALEGFRSHQLAELDKANLMNRVDVKFMLPIAFLDRKSVV